MPFDMYRVTYLSNPEMLCPNKDTEEGKLIAKPPFANILC